MQKEGSCALEEPILPHLAEICSERAMGPRATCPGHCKEGEADRARY